MNIVKKDEYKRGDTVVIVNKRIGSYWNSNGLMDKWLGHTMTVREYTSGHYLMFEDVTENYGEGWSWFDHMILGAVENNSYETEIDFDDIITPYTDDIVSAEATL